MVDQRLYVAQFVVALEDRWLGPNGEEPLRVERQYRIESQLFAAADAEAAYRTACDWLPGFSDSNHDGPGDLFAMLPVGIHEIDEAGVHLLDLSAVLGEPYGVSVGNYNPADVDESGAPRIRTKSELAIFRF